MKFKTHDIFGTGVLTLVGAYFTSSVYSLIAAAIIAIASTRIIDGFGHVRNAYGMPVRTARTHCPSRAFIFGFVPAVIFYIWASNYGWKLGLAGPYWFVFIQGALAGQLHLLLDLPTGEGIFVNKKRMAAAHFAYDDPVINTFFILLGFGFVYETFKGHFGRFI